MDIVVQTSHKASHICFPIDITVCWTRTRGLGGLWLGHNTTKNISGNILWSVTCEDFEERMLFIIRYKSWSMIIWQWKYLSNKAGFLFCGTNCTASVRIRRVHRGGVTGVQTHPTPPGITRHMTGYALVSKKCRKGVFFSHTASTFSLKKGCFFHSPSHFRGTM